jgi:valyl-tRNA synthetase
LLVVLETSLRALHPIMPFITEEIWQRIRTRLGVTGDSIMLQAFPEAGPVDAEIEQEVSWLMEVIQGVRRIRSELNVSPAKPLEAWFQSGSNQDLRRLERFGETFAQLAKIRSFCWVEESADTAQCAVALVGDLKILVPLKGVVDVEAEITRLRKQLDAERALLEKASAKLDNHQFVSNAPAAVVAQEQERKKTQQANVDKLLEQIHQLESL